MSKKRKQESSDERRSKGQRLDECSTPGGALPDDDSNSSDSDEEDTPTPEEIQRRSASRRKLTIQYHLSLYDLNQAFLAWARDMREVQNAEDRRDPDTLAALPRPGTLDYFLPYLEATKNYRYRALVLRRRFSRPSGNVVVFGAGDCGQLGCGEVVTKARIPRVVPRLKGLQIDMVCAGGLHNLALTHEGEVYSWGCDDDGSLGVEPKQVGYLPKKVTGFHPSEYGPNGRDNEDIIDPNTKAIIPFIERKDAIIFQIAAGETQSLALSDKGDVYFFGGFKDDEGAIIRHMPPDDETRPLTGRKDLSKLENSDKPENYLPPRHGHDFPSHVVEIPGKAKDIACGAQHCAALLEDNTIVTWGVDDKGALGRTVEKFNKAMSIEVLREMYLKPAPPTWAKPMVKREVVMIACGAFHFMVVTRDEEEEELAVYSCGLNNYGQLGHGDLMARDKLTKIEFFKGKEIATAKGGFHHSLFLTMDGRTLYGCGRNDYCQMGCTFEQPDAGQEVKTPVRIPLVYKPEVVEQLVEGEKKITYVGVSNPKEYSIVEERVVDEDQPEIIQISCGHYHNFALTSDGDLYSWGFGESGACGQGKSDLDVLRPTLVKRMKDGPRPIFTYVSGGGQHSVAVVAPH